jgi:UDP-glucose 4-epimerase
MDNIDNLIQQYRGKHILVTGSTGYLANNLIHMLKQVECHITRVARTGKILTLVNGACNVEDIIGDITQPELWQKVLPKVDIVFHFAGQSNITQANNAPAEDIPRSIIPLVLLLDTSRKMNLHPHVVLSSSVSLYGNPAVLPVDESCADDPQTIYDIHKLQCEQYLSYFIKQQTVTGCSLRLSNVYGPGIQAGRDNSGLINHAIYTAIEHEPIHIHGKGENIRDYLYLDDATRAFLAAGLCPTTVNGQRLIVSTGQQYSVQQVIDKVTTALKELRGIHAQVDYGATTADTDTRHFCGNAERFRQATGWQPHTSLDEGIALTIKAV